MTTTSQKFTVVDVGGQRGERRKWLGCLSVFAVYGSANSSSECVTAVLYLVALNEYDMVLEEDNKTNRMEESLKLFAKVSGSHWLTEITFILFLNKCDLLKVCCELFGRN